MSPGARKNIDDVLARFQNGLGAVLSKKYEINGTTRRTESIDVYLIPHGLCKDGSKGLIIIAGKGHFIWDGTYQLSGFKLIGSGIYPLALAHDVAAIANAMRTRMVEVSAPAEAPLAIEGPKK